MEVWVKVRMPQPKSESKSNSQHKPKSQPQSWPNAESKPEEVPKPSQAGPDNPRRDETPTPTSEQPTAQPRTQRHRRIPSQPLTAFPAFPAFPSTSDLIAAHTARTNTSSHEDLAFAGVVREVYIHSDEPVLAAGAGDTSHPTRRPEADRGNVNGNDRNGRGERARTGAEGQGETRREPLGLLRTLRKSFSRSSRSSKAKPKTQPSPTAVHMGNSAVATGAENTKLAPANYAPDVKYHPDRPTARPEVHTYIDPARVPRLNSRSRSRTRSRTQTLTRTGTGTGKDTGTGKGTNEGRRNRTKSFARTRAALGSLFASVDTFEDPPLPAVPQRLACATGGADKGAHGGGLGEAAQGGGAARGSTAKNRAPKTDGEVKGDGVAKGRGDGGGAVAEEVGTPRAGAEPAADTSDAVRPLHPNDPQATSEVDAPAPPTAVETETLPDISLDTIELRDWLYKLGSVVPPSSESTTSTDAPVHPFGAVTAANEAGGQPAAGRASNADAQAGARNAHLASDGLDLLLAAALDIAGVEGTLPDEPESVHSTPPLTIRRRMAANANAANANAADSGSGTQSNGDAGSPTATAYHPPRASVCGISMDFTLASDWKVMPTPRVTPTKASSPPSIAQAESSARLPPQASSSAPFPPPVASGEAQTWLQGSVPRPPSRGPKSQPNSLRTMVSHPELRRAYPLAQTVVSGPQVHVLNALFHPSHSERIQGGASRVVSSQMASAPVGGGGVRTGARMSSAPTTTPTTNSVFPPLPHRSHAEAQDHAQPQSQAQAEATPSVAANLPPTSGPHFKNSVQNPPAQHKTNSHPTAPSLPPTNKRIPTPLRAAFANIRAEEASHRAALAAECRADVQAAEALDIARGGSEWSTAKREAAFDGFWRRKEGMFRAGVVERNERVVVDAFESLGYGSGLGGARAELGTAEMKSTKGAEPLGEAAGQNVNGGKYGRIAKGDGQENVPPPLQFADEDEWLPRTSRRSVTMPASTPPRRRGCIPPEFMVASSLSVGKSQIKQEQSGVDRIAHEVKQATQPTSASTATLRPVEATSSTSPSARSPLRVDVARANASRTRPALPGSVSSPPPLTSAPTPDTATLLTPGIDKPLPSLPAEYRPKNSPCAKHYTKSTAASRARRRSFAHDIPGAPPNSPVQHTAHFAADEACQPASPASPPAPLLDAELELQHELDSEVPPPNHDHEHGHPLGLELSFESVYPPHTFPSASGPPALDWGYEHLLADWARGAEGDDVGDVAGGGAGYGMELDSSASEYSQDSGDDTTVKEHSELAYVNDTSCDFHHGGSANSPSSTGSYWSANSGGSVVSDDEEPWLPGIA